MKRFGFDSTATEVIEGINLSGKSALVTGASSGIGIETARALAAAGAAVTLGVRNLAAGRRVTADIERSTGNHNLGLRHLELTDAASIEALVAGWSGPLDILVNNAGMMAGQELTLTDRSYEVMFASNHLGHFTLCLGLHDALAAAGSARVVSVSSVAHLLSPVNFDDLHFSSRPYNAMVAYAQSKTANVLFAVEATRRWREDGIRVNAVHPGAVAVSNLVRRIDPVVLAALRESSEYDYKTLEQGAATSVFVATSPALDGIGGRYFEDCDEASIVEPGPDRRSGVAPFALDDGNATRLWEVSLGLIRNTS